MASLFSTDTSFFILTCVILEKSRVLKLWIPDVILSLFVSTCLNPPPEAKYREGREKLENRSERLGRTSRKSCWAAGRPWGPTGEMAVWPRHSASCVVCLVYESTTTLQIHFIYFRKFTFWFQEIRNHSLVLKFNM